MRFREGDPDMTWQEARLQIGAAEGAIALLMFAVPSYLARQKREQEDAWKAANVARKARADEICAMPRTTEAEFRAAVEAIAVASECWFTRFARPILHFIWYEDRVTVCDGKNTARWFFGIWSEWADTDELWSELSSVLGSASAGANWDAECDEHELWSD